mmetsp:Transcript_43704/g.117149  ORF Transcript_43704/g.117149 Transcript_43704/m.117149 type:complete len:203 (-) Transcript_43704:1134-1742(-)
MLRSVTAARDVTQSGIIAHCAGSGAIIFLREWQSDLGWQVFQRGALLNYHTMWSPHRVRGPDGKARRRHGHEDPGRDLTLHVASTKALPVFTEQLWVVCCGSTGENRPKKRNWMKTGWRCRRRRPRARGRGVCHKHHPHVAEHYDRRTICAIPTMAPRTPPSRMRIHSSSLKIGCSRFSNLSGGILCKASLFLRSMSVICPM